MKTETVESELAAKREEIKRKIKRAEIWNEELDRRRALLHACVSRIEDGLPSEFEKKVEPWQAELGAIQDAEMEVRLDGGQPDAGSEPRKKELRELIDQAGLELEESIASEEKRQKRLLDELRDWQQDIRENVVSVLESRLAALVSDERKNRHLALKQCGKALGLWVKEVQKRLNDWRAELARPDIRFSNETRQRLKSRLPRVEAELAVGREKLSQTQREASDLWKSFLED